MFGVQSFPLFYSRDVKASKCLTYKKVKIIFGKSKCPLRTFEIGGGIKTNMGLTWKKK